MRNIKDPKPNPKIEIGIPKQNRKWNDFLLKTISTTE